MKPYNLSTTIYNRLQYVVLSEDGGEGRIQERDLVGSFSLHNLFFFFLFSLFLSYLLRIRIKEGEKGIEGKRVYILRWFGSGGVGG